MVNKYWIYIFIYLVTLNTTSKIFLIDIANNLKKTKLMPSHPNNTEIDNKLVLRSRCKYSCIKNEISIYQL